MAIKSFNWENAFNGNDINSQVEFIHEILMNIFGNLIPNNIKTFRDSDPPWMNDDINNKLTLKHKLEDLDNEIFDILSNSKKEYYSKINRKLNYPSISRKIYCSINSKIFWSISSKIYWSISSKIYWSISSKMYWSISSKIYCSVSSKISCSIRKAIFNGEKVVAIPYLLFNGTFVTDFQEKANIFNFFFAKQ